MELFKMRQQQEKLKFFIIKVHTYHCKLYIVYKSIRISSFFRNNIFYVKKLLSVILITLRY